MRHHLFTFALLSSLMLAACGQQQSAPRTEMPTQDAEPAALAQQAAPAASAVVPATPLDLEVAASAVGGHTPVANASAPTQVTTHQIPYAKPFIIQADLTFRTEDVRKTAVAIEKLATELGGFVVSNQTNSDIINRRDFQKSDGMLLRLENYVSHTNLVVRIPRQNTQAFLHGIQPHILWLERQYFSAENVHVQLHRQMLTAQREQQHAQDLQQLNKTTPAQQDDRRATLNAQYQAREQADEMKAQQIELQDKIEYATINLHFNQPEQIAKTVTPNPERVAAEYRPGLWESIKQAMVSSWHHLFAILLFIVQIWYIWVIGVGIWWWKRVRPHRIKKYHEEAEYIATEDWDVPEAAPTEPAKPSRRRKKFKQYDDEHDDEA